MRFADVVSFLDENERLEGSVIEVLAPDTVESFNDDAYVSHKVEPLGIERVEVLLYAVNKESQSVLFGIVEGAVAAELLYLLRKKG